MGLAAPAPLELLGACLEAAVAGSPGGELTARLSLPELALVFLIAWVCPDSVQWSQRPSLVSDADGVTSTTPGLRLHQGGPWRRRACSERWSRLPKKGDCHGFKRVPPKIQQSRNSGTRGCDRVWRKGLGG